MTQSSPEQVSLLLQSWRLGNRTALDRLVPLVYDDLHRIAHRYMRRERFDQTLQTTALVHEAYLRLVDIKGVEVSIDKALIIPANHSLLEIDEALNTLSELDPRKAKVVELKFYGGLSVKDAAEVLGISAETVKRDWRLAKVWLLCELKDSEKDKI